MDLKEAYELRRRELIKLKKENEQLKKGCFTAPEKASLEKQVRELTNELKAANAAVSTYAKALARKRSENSSMVDRIQELEAEVSKLKLELSFEKSRKEKLEEVNSKLKAQAKRDYETSSKPSSDKPLHKLIANNREKSGKKPGAQPKHEGKNLKRPENAETEVIHIEVPDTIKNSKEWYPTGKVLERYVIEIRMDIKVKNYTADEYRSRTTKKLYHAPFPVNALNKINYGSSVKALAFLLNNICNVSIAKTKNFIYEVTDGLIDISTGEISNLLKEFSRKSEQEQKKIFNELATAPVLYSDATVSRVNGKGKAVIVCATPNAVQFYFKDHKGHEGLKETPVEFSTGTLVHDHDKTYYSYGGNHQECLAHILRYLKDAMQNEPNLTWHKKMHAFLQGIIHRTKENSGIFEADELRQLEHDYGKILDTAFAEYCLNPHPKWYPEGENLYKRLVDYRDSVLFFTTHPEVDYTNNLSERCCRNYKRKRQQMVTHRSQEAADNLCKALGILLTERSRGVNLYAKTKEYFKGTSTP